MSRFIVNKKKEQERNQLNDIPLEDYIESMAKNELCYFINERYQTKPIIAYLKRKGFYETDMSDKWSYRARLAFVVNLNEIDYARFKIGFHMVNKIPTLYRLNVAKNMAKVWENLKISMQLGYLDTFINLDEMIPEMYILDSIPDLWQFLNCENNGIWEVINGNYCEENPPLEVPDVMKFKHKILWIRKLEKHEISSGEDTDEEVKIKSPGKSGSKKGRTILDPDPDPTLNPNLPNLLHTKCRGLKRAASSLSQKVIVKKELDNDLPQIVLTVHLLLASVKPYLSIIQSEKWKEDIKQFISEREAAASAKSTELPYEVTGADEEETCEKVLVQIKEFSRLLMMEMKWHITPVFGCFEFFECSFIFDSHYNLRFRTIESNSSIFNKTSVPVKEKIGPQIISEKISREKIAKLNNINLANVFKDGMEIVLRLHEIGWTRTEKSTFKCVLDMLKLSQKWKYEFLYTDFE